MKKMEGERRPIHVSYVTYLRKWFQRHIHFLYPTAETITEIQFRDLSVNGNMFREEQHGKANLTNTNIM